MKMNYLFLCVVLCFVVIHGRKLPSGFTTCHLSDPKFEECLKDAMEKAFKLIGSKGIQSINIPSIDPIDITTIEIGAGTGAVNLVQYYYEAKFYGLSDQKVQKVHFDKDKKTLSFTSYNEELRQTAKYELDGKILVIPVKGKGDCTIEFKKCVQEHNLVFKEVMKNGKKHFVVDKYTVVMTPGLAQFEFLNLFDGDKALGDSINKVINENWQVLVEDVKPGISKAYGEVYKTLANRFFESVPIDEIFLP